MNNFTKIRERLDEGQELVSKDKIMHYQAQQVKKGNRISWADAKKAVEAPILQAIKDAKKAAAKAKRAARPKKPRAPRKKYITRSQFEKRCKGAAQDFVGDTASDLKHEFPDMSKQELEGMAYEQLHQVAWDLAGSLMYDQDIRDYVEKELKAYSARGITSDDQIQEYIADCIV